MIAFIGHHPKDKRKTSNHSQILSKIIQHASHLKVERNSLVFSGGSRELVSNFIRDSLEVYTNLSGEDVCVIWVSLKPLMSMAMILQIVGSSLVRAAGWFDQSKGNDCKESLVFLDLPGDVDWKPTPPKALRNLLPFVAGKHVIFVVEPPVRGRIADAETADVVKLLQDLGDYPMMHRVDTFVVNCDPQYPLQLSDTGIVPSQPEVSDAARSAGPGPDARLLERIGLRSGDLVRPMYLLAHPAHARVFQFIADSINATDRDLEDFRDPSLVRVLQSGALDLTEQAENLVRSRWLPRGDAEASDAIARANASRILSYDSPMLLQSTNGDLQDLLSRIPEHSAPFILCSELVFGVFRHHHRTIDAVAAYANDVHSRIQAIKTNEHQVQALVNYLGRFMLDEHFPFSPHLFKIFEDLSANLSLSQIDRSEMTADAIVASSRTLYKVGYVFDRLVSMRKLQASTPVRSRLYGNASKPMASYRPKSPVEAARIAFRRGAALWHSNDPEAAAEVYRNVIGELELVGADGGVGTIASEWSVLHFYDLLAARSGGATSVDEDIRHLERLRRLSGIPAPVPTLKSFLVSGLLEPFWLPGQPAYKHQAIAIHFTRFDFSAAARIARYVIDTMRTPVLMCPVSSASGQPVAPDPAILRHVVVGASDSGDGIAEFLNRTHPTLSKFYHVRMDEEFGVPVQFVHEGMTFVALFGSGVNGIQDAWVRFLDNAIAHQWEEERLMLESIGTAVLTRILTDASSELCKAFIERIKQYARAVEGTEPTSPKVDEFEARLNRLELQIRSGKATDVTQVTAILDVESLSPLQQSRYAHATSLSTVVGVVGATLDDLEFKVLAVEDVESICAMLLGLLNTVEPALEAQRHRDLVIQYQASLRQKLAKMHDMRQLARTSGAALAMSETSSIASETLVVGKHLVSDLLKALPRG
ncbi:hypothetical protein NUH88_06395 [Nisaea acidiphila]|uniref:Uncharacterized protein n=1 Tax=Nisaea acidiphila TaxID=1862145 RepID=A0A9J7AVH0_9PROT|nr:hypothetical protein [Nisaea acidiphila]UUX51320.1 hypothetical protein NUH88_06395 [Nisaea acidiphila]